MLNNKIDDDAATDKVSVWEWRHWRSVVVQVLEVVIFGEKIVSNARYGTPWSI